MNLTPSGPRGPQRPKQPTTLTSDQGSVQKASVGKQIPSGQSPQRRSLDEWKIDPVNITPAIPKPSRTAVQEYQGADAKERVLEMLGQMEPDVDPSEVHRVSSERRQEMAERMAGVYKAMGSELVRKAFDSGALSPGLDDFPPDTDITLNYVMALALKIRRAQDEIRAGINADRSDLQAWLKGLKLFSQLQDAWHELHPIVTDICRCEPFAFEVPLPAPERMESQDSDDSGVGDLIDLDDPWNQPQPLVSPATVTLPPATEARISQLEQALGNTLDHLRHERVMNDRLQQSQEKVESLARSNQHLVNQYSQLRKEVEVLRSKSGGDPEAFRKLEDQVNQLQSEKVGLMQQLTREKQALSQRNSEFVQLQRSLTDKDAEVKKARSSREIDQEKFAHNKKRSDSQIAELEETLSQQMSELSSLKSHIRELEDTNENLSHQLKIKESEISLLTSTLSDVRTELSETKEEVLSELEKFTKSTGAEKEDYAQEIKDFEQKGRLQFLAKLEEITELKRQLDTVGQEYKRKELEAEELHQIELRARDEVKASQTEEMNRLTRELEGVKKKLKDLEGVSRSRIVIKI